MLGAIIGDIVGSRFEWHNIKTKDFILFYPKCRPTDDSVMTLAIAKAIMDCGDDYSDLGTKAVEAMQSIGRNYPRCGYGRKFISWIYSNDPKPYNSYGNGAAMRVSPCAYAARSLEEAIDLSRKVTEVTHNHPEGIKGAEAVAVAVYMAKTGSSIEEIREHITANYYPMDFSLDSIRSGYRFDSSCQGSVPQAIAAFLESTDFEDAIRNAVSIGGDSDTIAAIAGSIAEAYYGIPNMMRAQAILYLDNRQFEILNEFDKKFGIPKSEENL